jgi:hypothetical protein
MGIRKVTAYAAVRSLLIFVFALGCCVPFNIWAQASLGTATLSGTVRDASGLAVPKAKILVTNTERGDTRQTETNDSGSYALPNLPTGQYRLEAQKAGFDSKRVTGLQLQVGQVATVDVVLQPGTLSTVISVSGEQATLIETESNVIGTVVNAHQVQDLPLNGRDFLQLALTASGSSQVTGGSDVYSSQIGHPNRAVVINGNPPTTTGYTINGIATRGQRLGESAVNLSIAAIDQFKVQQCFFLPDPGPDPGLINITTRGGTNSFHGQAFEFLRNEAFDARSFFAQKPEALKRNQFGGAIGGPIRKDKLWFYGFYEGLRQISAFNSNAFTPTQSMFNGNFGALRNVIYDPATYNPVTGTRSPFAGNVIPQNRINAVSRNLLNYYLPGASLSLVPNNLFANPRNSLDDDQGGLRIDALLSTRQSLFGQVVHETGLAVNPGTFPLSGAAYPNTSTLAMLQHTWTVTPTFVNTVRAGFTRAEARFTNQGTTAGHILGGLGVLNTLDDQGVSGVNLTGYSSFGRANGNLGNIDNNYQLDEGANWVRGSHTLQFGAGIRYHRTWQQNANANALGTVAFQPFFTAQLTRSASGTFSALSGTGDSFADFLLGTPFNASLAGLPMFQYRFTEYQPYIQDTWRVRSNLTLNLGLSWYLSTVPDPQGSARQFVHGFNPQTGLLTYAALGQVSPQVTNLDKNNWTPRIGFAWTPSNMHNTVIRGGVGLYYFNSALSEAQFAMVAPPFNTPLQLFNTQPNPTYVLGQNIFPASSFPALSSSTAAALPTGTTAFLLNPNAPVPYVTQWNFSLERALGADNSIELDYLGSSSHRLQNRYDLNQCIPNASSFCSPAAKPYARYAGLLTAEFNGNSSYEAMYAKFNHRAGFGLNFRLEYTWSKVLIDAFEGPNVATSTQVASCRACDKGLASYDQRHRVVASTIFDIPFGKGRRFGSQVHPAVNAIAGEWTITAITTFATGVPIFITSPSQTSSIYVSQRPIRTCDGGDPNLADNLRTNGLMYFNTSCFQTPASGYFGNSGRTPISGPGQNNWDIGVHKQFALGLGEATRLELRGEFFNAFNHAQFTNPNANTGSGANFGRVTNTLPPRLVQIAMKLTW